MLVQNIAHVTHLQAVCYISSVYPWALCKVPGRILKNETKLGFRYSKCFPLVTRFAVPQGCTGLRCFVSLQWLQSLPVLTKYNCWAGGLLCLSLPLCVCFSVYICLPKWEYGVEMFSQSSHSLFFFLFVKPFSSSSSYSSCLLQSTLKQSVPCHILGGKWHWYWTKCKKRLFPCENYLIDVKSNNFKELWWLQIGSEGAIPVHSTSRRGSALQFKQQHFGIQSFFITQTNQISNLSDLDAWQ